MPATLPPTAGGLGMNNGRFRSLTPLTGLDKLMHEGQTVRDSMQVRLVIACSESQTRCHRSVTVA